MSSRFKLGTDYKKAFETAVNELINRNIGDRNERIRDIDDLINEYVYAVGSAPDPIQLERLANYILREELTDPNPYKVSHNEYPVMSEWQLEKRKGREYSLKLAEEVGTDGKNYAPPKRRKRTAKENWLIDKRAQSRNKERRRKYREFTKPGEVITYNLAEKDIKNN